MHIPIRIEIGGRHSLPVHAYEIDFNIFSGVSFYVFVRLFRIGGYT